MNYHLQPDRAKYPRADPGYQPPGALSDMRKVNTPIDIPSFRRYRALTEKREKIMQNLTGRHYFYFGYYFYYAGLPAVC